MSATVDASHAKSDTLKSSTAPRLLLISYYFPPAGGLQAQRAAKFVKYLGQFGWRATVLAAANPTEAITDHTLCADVPGDVTVVGVPTWEPESAVPAVDAFNRSGRAAGPVSQVFHAGRQLVRRGVRSLLQPDVHSAWVPSAFQKAVRFLSHVPHTAIVATGPPDSNWLLGAMLRQRFKLPLLLDHCFEWNDGCPNPENGRGNPFSRFVRARMQRAILRRADAIVAATETDTRRLQEQARQLGCHPVCRCIFHGFDTDDFTSLTEELAGEPAGSERFRLVCIGNQATLSTMAPLVQAVMSLQNQKADWLKQLELVYLGDNPPQETLERIAQTSCSLRIEEPGDRRHTLRWMASGQAVCLSLRDIATADRTIPAALFDCLAMEKRTLAIMPDGEAAEIMRRFFPHGHFPPADIAGIADWLQSAVLGNGLPVEPAAGLPDRDRFRVDHLTGQLADVLETIRHAH